jgi:PEP-CTERM motif-containing protein
MNKYLGPLMAIFLLFAARDSQATVMTYFVSLYGSVDASGSTSLLGHGRISIDPENYTLDWSFDVSGVTTLKEATIREGAPGLAGPQVVRLRNEMNGQGLRDADLAAIVLRPNDYYVMLRPKVDATMTNIRAYRGIRGQLTESSAVPEPTTLTLLGLGLAAGGLRSLRRRKSAA